MIALHKICSKILEYYHWLGLSLYVLENFGEFGELNVIHQYFTQPNLSPLFVKLPDKIFAHV